MPRPLRGPVARRIASAVRRVGRILGHTADVVPPTWRGLLIAGLCAGALWHWGFGAMDLLVFVFGVSGLALFGVSVLMIGIAGWRLGNKAPSAGRKRQRLEAGTPLDTGFELPALARWPLVKVAWQWTDPAGVVCRQELRARRDPDGKRSREVLREVAVARRRCQVSTVERHFTVRCAFGLSRVAWRHRESAPLTVLPEVGKLRSVDVLQSIASAEGLPHPSGAPEGDRMDIRRYVPGDSMRHILWKTFARTRTLNVRTPERAVDRSERTVAYLLCGRGDEPAAAAARVALERGLLGERWIFGADGCEPAEELETALQVLARSGSWRRPEEASPADGLRRFLSHPSVAGERHCVLFAPSVDGHRWADEVLATVAAAGMGASFVLGTDGIERGGTRPMWRRVLFAAPGAATAPHAAESVPTPAHELDSLVRRLDRASLGTGAGASLSAARGRVVVVDRATGRAHGGAATRALRMAG